MTDARPNAPALFLMTPTDHLFPLLRKLLFSLEPERSHALALSALEQPWLRRWFEPTEPRPDKAVSAFGLDFANAVGLAAGLDKNGDHIDALGALGFGHIEIGTITPKPQDGNPKPRLFRLEQYGALINRMGFNNKGVAHLVANAEKRQYKGVLGINIGKNATTPIENALDDYRHCLERVFPVADYVTVNISSPNTKNLRALQDEEPLRALLGELREQQALLAAKHAREVPLLVKIAPDVSDVQLDGICNVARALALDGMIVGNTTLERASVEPHVHAGEAGGLSGAPLRPLADSRLAATLERLDGEVPVIGVGGIDSGAAAANKIELGAQLVQIYTGFIYHGPALVRAAVRATSALADDVKPS